MTDNKKLIFSKIRKDNSSLKLLCDFICENVRKNLSIKEISHNVTLHPNYIFELFNKNLGISPHQYQMQLKIDAAKKELVIGKNLADVALDLELGADVPADVCAQVHRRRGCGRAVAFGGPRAGAGQ
jgi:AraC-like DNA-binding protein